MPQFTKASRSWILVAVMILKVVQEPWAQDHATPSEYKKPDTLQSFIDYALSNNPRIEAAKKDVETQRKQISIASSLPDPMLMSKFGSNGLKSIGGSQMIMFPTKILTERKAAQALLEKEQAALDQVRSEVISEITDAYSDLYSTERMRSILKENMELLKFLEESARVKYTAGKAAQSELVKLQIELARVEDQLESMSLEADSYRSRLAALLNVDSLNQITFTNTAAVSPKFAGSDEQITDASLSGNNRLAMMNRELEAAEHMVSLAKQRYLPDFEIGAEYMQDGGMGGSWGVGVNMTVPLWVNKNQAGIEKAHEMVELMRKSILDMENMIRSETRMHLNHLRDARRKMRLYTDALIPQARQVVELTQTEYRSGISGVMELVDSQRTLLELEDMYTKEQLRAQKAEVELIKLTGATK